MAPLLVVAVVLVAFAAGGIVGALTTVRVSDKVQLHAHAKLAGERDAAAADRDYWKARGEQLLDGALMRGGQLPGPIMQPPAPKGTDPAGRLLAGMAVSEIDSRAKPQPS